MEVLMLKIKKKISIFFIFFTFLFFYLQSQQSKNSPITENSQVHNFKIITHSKNLNYPWGIAALPNGHLLITEKRNARMVYWDKNEFYPLSVIEDVVSIGQGGLLDVFLSPDFENDSKIYFTFSTYYNGDFNKYSTALSCAKIDTKAKRLYDIKTLFIADNDSGNSIHFGSRIAFDDEGYLYITLGDRGEKHKSQSLSHHHGKVLRLGIKNNLIYIPQSNPFVNKKNAKPEIYSYGHRNPQGLVFFNGQIWLHEHGPRGGDEINIVKKSRNYGWPIVTHGKNYSGTTIGKGINKQVGMESPFLHWTPSIAPCGMLIYTGDLFPRWKNNIFVGSLVKKHLRRVVINTNPNNSPSLVKQEKLLSKLGNRIRDVEQDNDGNIYVITDSWNGKLLQLLP